MATIKIPYTVQSCSVCGKELLKIQSGTQEIGSPLVTCPNCGKVYRTDMRVEWYAYRYKWITYGMAPFLFVTMTLVGSVLSDPVIGILSGIFGLFIGLFMTLKEIPKIVKSKKRMRSARYLEQLRQAGLITQEDYTNFRSKSDKP